MKSQTFEQSLRAAVRRLSRRNFEDQIREVADHYQDLFQEQMAKGISEVEARVVADERIGSEKDIARQIVRGTPRSRGLKLQWLAMALWIFGAFLYRILGMNGVEFGSLRGNIIEAAAPIGIFSIYAAGFLAMLGIVHAKRVALLAIGLTVVLIFVGHTAILLRFSRSFSTYDARVKAHDDRWHAYAGTYRPILTERYNLYVSSISGTQDESDKAIRKLSASIRRPQDRGAVILDGFKGAWLYPLKEEKIRERNITIFPYRDNNLNYIFFGATDSFADAQKEWRTSSKLLAAIPLLRKGSEAEFAATSKMHRDTAMATIFGYVVLSVIPFICSFALSLVLFGIVTKFKQLISRIRPAL